MLREATMLAKKVFAAGVLGCVFACFLCQQGAAKQLQKTGNKQKYVCMSAVNSALEHVPYLTVRFAMAIKHAKEVLALLKDDAASSILNAEGSNIFLDEKIMHIVEPIKVFLMVAREQRSAVIPLFEQVFAGEVKDKGLESKNKLSSCLVAFCKGVDQQAYDFFKKTITSHDELQLLSEEVILVFGAILHDLTEPAKKSYDEAVEAVRKISCDKVITPLEL